MDDNGVETLIENKPIPDPNEDDDDQSLIDDELEEGVAYQSLSESDSDDEFRKITNFSAEEALEILYNQLSYTKIFIDYDLQKELTLNVSHEHPWMTIKKDLLEEYLTDNTVETENLRAKLSLFDANDSVVIGFHSPGQDVVEEGIFIVYDEIESILVAAELIRKLEIFHRFKIKRALQKKPTRGVIPSRLEFKDTTIPKRPLVSVELQTSYPIYKKTVKFSFRKSSDCRDGYSELVPSSSQSFENVYRRRIAQAIQSAPQRFDREQQTDPTFPTNAHTQYFYEITKDGNDKEANPPDDGKSQATVNAVVEQEQGAVAGGGGEAMSKSGGDQHEWENSEEDDETVLSMETVHQKPIVVSKQIKELIRTLDYNQIDMYRNEYESIGRRAIPKFKVPFLEEVFCFNDIDIAKTGNRHVSPGHIEWHPQFSGLFVATYTWNTLSTFVSYETDHKVDFINQIILQPNYIYMWTFEDILNPLLSFESPREVSIVSFHPLDPNCLIGGMVNGQVIIWDLTGVLENLGKSDDLTLSEMQHREDMRKFLNWTKHSFNNDVVKRSAVSCLEFSQTDRITQIKWLNSSINLNSSGDIKEQSDKSYRYFVTSSLDGTIAFWNLEDGSIPEETVEPAKPKKKQQTPLPETAKKPKSRFDSFDRKFRPQFVVVLQYPISSFGLNEARFVFSPVNKRQSSSSLLSLRREFTASEVPFALEREFTVEDEEEGAFHNQVLVTTTMGDLIMVKWKSSETDPAGVSNRHEKPILHIYPAIHDGPIVALDKNPLLPLLVLAVGMTTVSIWRTDFNHSAIYWQHRGVELTNCKWSLQRPSVFFLTRVDGSVEVWDLLSKTEDPCLIETISGGILTTLSQHRLKINEDILAIGDFNSNIRIFKVPKSFSQFTKDDEVEFTAQINREVERKRGLQEWQAKWMKDNADVLKVQNKLQQDRISTANQVIRDSGKDSRNKKAGKKDVKSKTLEEIGELKWERLNLKRLMKIMMNIKGIDSEECNQKTLPIREQRAYNEFKRQAIKKTFSQIGTDFADIRSRILPVKEDIKDRRDIIKDLVKETILGDNDNFSQEEFDKEMETKLNQMPERPIYSLSEIKQRGRQIREILNKSSGVNFVHKDMYEMYKKGRNGSALSDATNQKDKSLSSSPTKRMFSTSASPH